MGKKGFGSNVEGGYYYLEGEDSLGDPRIQFLTRDISFQQYAPAIPRDCDTRSTKKLKFTLGIYSAYEL